VLGLLKFCPQRKWIENYTIDKGYKVQLQIIVRLAETTTALSVLLESSSLAVDTDSDVDYPAFVRWETAVLHAWEHDGF